MKSREFDPLRLDVEAFAKTEGTLDGVWPLKSLRRLAESMLVPSPDVLEEPVQWAIRGERREPRAAVPQSWLHVQGSTHVWLECQRCLQVVQVPLAANRSFLFVAGEEAAAELDAVNEDDVLALSRAFDAQELLEEELLLSLPLVPKHEACPQPLSAPSDDLAQGDAPHPFAGLAALKRGGLPN